MRWSTICWQNANHKWLRVVISDVWHHSHLQASISAARVKRLSQKNLRKHLVKVAVASRPRRGQGIGICSLKMWAAASAQPGQHKMEVWEKQRGEIGFFSGAGRDKQKQNWPDCQCGDPILTALCQERVLGVFFFPRHAANTTALHKPDSAPADVLLQPSALVVGWFFFAPWDNSMQSLRAC